MAATNPPALPQEHQKHQQHIDTLQSMLNLIFLQSGRFLKETQAGGGSGRMKQQLQRVVPHATERFHDALDELENEVRLAQTVLRRDMALLRQDRKKKEAAAAKQHEVEKARLAAEATNPPPATDNAPVKPEKPATPTQPEPPTAHDASEAATAMDTETDASKKEATADNNGNHEAKVPSPPKTSADTNAEPPKDPLFDSTPPPNNSNESDFDFDAMFGDSMDTSDQHNPDMMDTSGDMDFTLDSANDGSSLLRGLEDFARNGDSTNANQKSNMDMDFTMPDLPGLDTSANASTNVDSNATETAKPAPEPEPAPKPDESNPPAQPPPPPEEKKTEETADNNMNNNNDDMMGTMAADDLEDLFNMDEYANPEQSSFDDAFFNFE